MFDGPKIEIPLLAVTVLESPVTVTPRESVTPILLPRIVPPITAGTIISSVTGSLVASLLAVVFLIVI